MSDLPDVHFGYCQRCGQDGRDQTSDLTSADTPARSTTGNGIALEEFEGQQLCTVCIEALKNEKIDLENSRLHAENDKFFGQVGMTKGVV